MADTGRPLICLVSRKWPPTMGGMETYSFQLAKELEDYGTVSCRVLLGNNDGSVPSGVALVKFGIRTFIELLLTRRPADLTFVTDMASWPLALAAKIRRPSSRILLAAHGTDVSYPLRGGVKGRAYGAYLRLGGILLGRSPLVANSQATMDATSTYGFTNISNVSLATDMALRNGAAHGQHILFSGRLIRLKGLSWFVKNVLPRLPEGITLKVAGTLWDADEVTALSDPRVQHIGYLNQADLADAYAEAACVIVPNIPVENGQFEGFGLVATEAAAAGGVVVAAAHGGLKEAVIDGVTGFSLPPADTDAWVQKIQEIFAWSESQREHFITNAHAAAREHFSWKRVASETIRAAGL